MVQLRQHPVTTAGGLKVLAVEDFDSSVKVDADGTESRIDLPRSNVIRYTLENDVWIVVRPSGTEPKLKLYIGGKGATEAAVDSQLKALTDDMDAVLSGYLFD